MPRSDHPATSNGSHQQIVFLGAYGRGIKAYRFDPAETTMDDLGMPGEITNPSFLATDPGSRYLYAVSEIEGEVEGRVAAFAIGPQNSTLRSLNQVSSGGVAPCHITVDRTGKMVIVANYGTGTVSAFPIEPGGTLGGISSLITAQGHSVNPKRQESPHAHQVVVSRDNQRAYVCDLGLDQIRIYRLDTARAALSPNDPPFVKQDSGMGPRHLVFSSDQSFAYVVNELKPEVSVFRHDVVTGAMTKIQDIATVPPGFSSDLGPAAILITRNNRFVYAGNRGNNTIVVFAVDRSSGTLQQVQSIPSRGEMPRGLALDPTERFLFVGNQKANNFVIFTVDPQTGEIGSMIREINTPAPVAFEFVAAMQ